MTPDQQMIHVSARLEAIAGDLGDVKSTLKELSAAVARLAVIEERQMTSNAAIERSFTAIRELEGRVDKLAARIGDLEQERPMQRYTSSLVLKAAALVLAAVLGAGVTLVTRPAKAASVIVGGPG